MPKPRACAHCGKALRSKPAGRGLCWVCYRDPAVFAATPPKRPGPPPREPTAAEVEATVAAQLERLPRWWAAECGRGPRVFTIVRDGCTEVPNRRMRCRS
ncbi:hypothetical protein VT84_09180 [Gemmata sp. SH-PL17]|uniref:hypothetical protein n=1 Tax=Gemmata sp. SH-PL17 TaxID=1630693 RepID=UPI00078C8E99|nr:hypothetical protein [Gemmata sp. SH-PL17]AMV24555.1 hypothetical protein VT84_09180 [Gemmata sp. SH-PL17]